MCTIHRNLFEIQTRHQWIQFASTIQSNWNPNTTSTQLAQFIETFLKSKHNINRYNLHNSLKFKHNINGYNLHRSTRTVHRNFFEIQTRNQSIQFVNFNLFEIHNQHQKTQLAQFIETLLKSKHRACVSADAWYPPKFWTSPLVHTCGFWDF